MAERDPSFDPRRNYPAYEEDYAAWLSAQLELLRSGQFVDLDTANLIDEVESLGRSDFEGFVSAIRLVLMHLLKWDIQSDHRTRSWANSIQAHRDQILWELQDSPSYKSHVDQAVERAYRRARLEAHQETKLPLGMFPETCPFSWEDITERPIVFGDARDQQN